MAVPGLCCCVQAFSSYDGQGLLSSGAQASHCSGLSCCEAQAVGAQTSLVAACGLSSCGSWALGRTGSVVWITGLVAPWHVGSSWTRDQTCGFLIGKQTLNH